LSWSTARSHRVGALGLALGLAGLAAAVGAAEDAPPLVELAFLEARLEEWPELTAVAREEAAEHLKPEGLQRLDRAIGEAFGRERLVSSVSAGLLAWADAERRRALREWYATPLGARVRGSGRGVVAADALGSLPEYLSAAMLGTEPSARLQALRRLDAAMGQTRDVLDVALAIALATGRGTHELACAPAAAWPSAEQRIRARVEASRRLVEVRVAAFLDFAYRDLATSDLSRVTGFLASSEMLWFGEGLDAEIRVALAQATQRSSELLAPHVAQACARGAS